MFGSAAKDALGQPISRVIPAQFRVRHDEHVERFDQTGFTTRAIGALSEITGLRKNGEEFPAEASISRIHSGAQPLFTVILRDITERKRAAKHVRLLNTDLAEANASLKSEIAERRQTEEARAKLESQLRQVQKIDSVGLLAGGVAHDFNNLLTPILGNADILVSDLAPGDPRHGQIAEIRQAAERARVITHQLLAFGRKQMLDLKPIDLADVVKRFEHMLRRTIREDVRIEVVADCASSSVRADVGQIEQVVLNLASTPGTPCPGEES
jgi:PAS domain S-box-containing protein